MITALLTSDQAIFCPKVDTLTRLFRVLMPERPPDHPNTPQEARELVRDRGQTIREAFESQNDFIQRLAQNYDHDLKRGLDTPAQVIPELLQNADDPKQCRTVEIQIIDDELRIRNDGRPLLEEEFRALRHIGRVRNRNPAISVISVVASNRCSASRIIHRSAPDISAFSSGRSAVSSPNISIVPIRDRPDSLECLAPCGLIHDLSITRG